MEGFRVKCRTCGLMMYETTAKYNCHKPLTGDMLRLLPLYKDWPTYDGSLATESTSRFLMFCSACAGYISTTGKLMFADFLDTKVTVISEERSLMCYEEKEEICAFLADNAGKGVCALKDKLKSVDMEGLDELQKMNPDLMTPEELMEKMKKGIG